MRRQVKLFPAAYKKGDCLGDNLVIGYIKF
jgi:hypothetical protein